MTQDMNTASSVKWERRPAITLTRMAIVLLIAIGYISTLPLGTQANEIFHHFGYGPSWIGINVLFMMAGFLGLQSLDKHKSPLQLFRSRFLRNWPMLVLFALMIIFIAYPLFGDKGQSFSSNSAKLGRYFIDVVTCLDPSTPVQGLLDNANYECLVQGTLWTFRWGILAYIGLAIGWKLGLFSHHIWFSVVTLSALMAYIIALALTVWNIVPYVDFALTGLRLGSMFCIGACAYIWKERIPRSWSLAAGILVLTAALYYLLPWTPFIEPALSLLWGYLTFLAFTTHRDIPKLWANLPDLSLEIYVFHWPVAQFLLLRFPETEPLGLIVMALPVTLALSWIFHAIITARIMPTPMPIKSSTA